MSSVGFALKCWLDRRWRRYILASMELQIVSADNRTLKFIGELQDFQAIMNLYGLESLLAPIATKTHVADINLDAPPSRASRSIAPISGAPGTTAAMVARLRVNGKLGKDLALAAIAKLAYSDRKETCTRKEIYAEMKSATGYFSKNMAKTLTQYLSNLLREGKIN